MRFNLSQNKTWILCFIFQVIMFFIFSKINKIISLFEIFFEWQKNFHTQIGSFFTFSLGDFLYLGLIIFLIVSIFKLLNHQTRRIFFKKILIILNLFYFFYQIFWGMMYFQEPISSQFSNVKVTDSRLKILAIRYLQLCKSERNRVDEDSKGVFKITNLEALKKEIIKNQVNISKNIMVKSPVYYESIKPSLWAKYLHFSGILGYYNPFTAEAQYNPNLPDSYLPFTISHETAHQMGYAREQEANFVGYLLGIHSQQSELKYSTYYYVLKSVLNSLYISDPVFVEKILEKYSPAMKRDREAEQKFQKENERVLDEFLYFTNDLFLKSNQQEGSITYSYFIDLLVKYEFQY